MKHVGIVYGSAEQARPLVIGKDTVYVHTDIKPATSKKLIDGELKEVIEEGLFSYDEVQYTTAEYLELMVQQNETLSSELTDTQLALCELYEVIGGTE